MNEKIQSRKDWPMLYQRQQSRESLYYKWFEALGLQAGDQLLDAGCGPGYSSLMAARIVGPGGLVYALDQERGALDYLQHNLQSLQVGNVVPVQANLEDFQLEGREVNKVLMGSMLHFNPDPATVLYSLTRQLSSGTLVLACEYDPLGPGNHGPEIARRTVSPDSLRAWMAAVNMNVMQYLADADGERYALLAQCI